MATESTPSSIVVRPYQPSDLPECLEIFTTVHQSYDNPMLFVEMSKQTDMADIEKHYLQIPNGNWWVAVDDNRIVGHVAVLPLSKNKNIPSDLLELPEKERDQICELLRMAVATDAQRKGVGKKLISTLMDFARERGYRQVYLTTLANMNKACAFYEKNGFIKRRIEKFAFDVDPSDTLEVLQARFADPPKPFIFEVGETIPDEDQRLMKLPPNQSKFIYVQHYYRML
jgi:ribosomal protein S18 acetylase RimI-like enzyme